MTKPAWTSRWTLAAACAIAAHLTALSAGFVWLDHAHLEEGWALAPLSRLPSLFTEGFAHTGYWRPLMALSLSVDAAIAGTGAGSAFVFHATSVAWHAIAAVALLAAAEALGASRRAATLAAILFAVHPLSNLVADAIAFRSEAMLATALFVLVWAHLEKRPVVAAAAIVGGCLTKETAFPLGVAFVVALALRVRERRLLAFEGAAFAAATALRLAFAPAWRAAHESLALGDAVGTRLASLAKTAYVAVLPIDRHVCDAFPITPVASAPAIAGAIVAAGVAWLAYRQRGAALLLALALLPSLQLVPVMRWWSPHYAYVPLGFAAIVLARAVERWEKPAWGVLALLGALTAWDGRKYASDTTLWTPEVEATTACREGQFYLGEAARERQRWTTAATYYEAAVAPRPRMIAYVDRGAALQNLGTVRLEEGKLGEARAAFREALEGTRDEEARRQLVHNLAALALRAGDPAEADRLLAPETSRPDAYEQSVVVHAMALRQLGRGDEADALLARHRR